MFSTAHLIWIAISLALVVGGIAAVRIRVPGILIGQRGQRFQIRRGVHAPGAESAVGEGKQFIVGVPAVKDAAEGHVQAGVAAAAGEQGIVLDELIQSLRDPVVHIRPGREIFLTVGVLSVAEEPHVGGMAVQIGAAVALGGEDVHAGHVAAKKLMKALQESPRPPRLTGKANPDRILYAPVPPGAYSPYEAGRATAGRIERKHTPQ